jgi:hypothetical protein
MSYSESMIAAHSLTGKLPKTSGEVSARFLHGVRKILEIYRSWGLKADVDLSGFTPIKRETHGRRVATSLWASTLFTRCSRTRKKSTISFT